MVHACACACVRATKVVTTRVCAGAVYVFLIENVRARFVRPFACWGVYSPRVDLRVMVIFNLKTCFKLCDCRPELSAFSSTTPIKKKASC